MLDVIITLKKLAEYEARLMEREPSPDENGVLVTADGSPAEEREMKRLTSEASKIFKPLLKNLMKTEKRITKMTSSPMGFHVEISDRSVYPALQAIIPEEWNCGILQDLFAPPAPEPTPMPKKKAGLNLH